MRPVNLLPKDDPRFERRRPANLPVLLGVAVAIVISAILAAWYLSASATATDKQAALDAARAELAALPVPQARPQVETTLATEKSQRVTVLSSMLATRVAWDRVLRQFAIVLPEDVWLTSLTAKAPTSPSTMAPTGAGPGAPPTGFTIVGRTYSHAAVARLLSRLQVVPDLANVTLQSSTREKTAGREIVMFTILADVRSGGKVA